MLGCTVTVTQDQVVELSAGVDLAFEGKTDVVDGLTCAVTRPDCYLFCVSGGQLREGKVLRYL